MKARELSWEMSSIFQLSSAVEGGFMVRDGLEVGCTVFRRVLGGIEENFECSGFC